MVLRFNYEMYVSLLFFCILLANAIVSVGLGFVYGQYKRDMPNGSQTTVQLFNYYNCRSSNNTGCNLLLYVKRDNQTGK